MRRGGPTGSLASPRAGGGGSLGIQVIVTLRGTPPEREIPGSRAYSQKKSLHTGFNGGWVVVAGPGFFATPAGWCPSKPSCSATLFILPHLCNTRLVPIQAILIIATPGRIPRHPLNIEDSKMEEDLKQVRERATKDLLLNFRRCHFTLFTFCVESESSFVSTSWANLGVIFSSW